MARSKSVCIRSNLPASVSCQAPHQPAPLRKEEAVEPKEIDDKIAHLFRLTHRDFIKAKIKIKKEFGLATAGL